MTVPVSVIYLMPLLRNSLSAMHVIINTTPAELAIIPLYKLRLRISTTSFTHTQLRLYVLQVRGATPAEDLEKVVWSDQAFFKG